MSWQRILRFARQRQVPVIVTDESGEDPMILLSLDQLEQALDGSIGPDLPPPPPAPRATTPSFVPDISSPEPEIIPVPEPVPTVSEEVLIPEKETLPSVTEEGGMPIPEGGTLNLLTDTSLETELLPKAVAKPEPEIITPDMPPVSQELTVTKPVVVPAAPAVQLSAAADLSLEERFFLDF